MYKNSIFFLCILFISYSCVGMNESVQFPIGITDPEYVALIRKASVPMTEQQAQVYAELLFRQLMLNGHDATNNGETPLLYALDSLNTKVCDALIDKGASVYVENYKGEMPLARLVKKWDATDSSIPQNEDAQNAVGKLLMPLLYKLIKNGANIDHPSVVSAVEVAINKNIFKKWLKNAANANGNLTYKELPH